ncbi:sugar ABC transporter permease [Arthrobacter flavus]|uniref:Carbohydrate ABC transporter permease n=1 Tax=Arthrobacter flavus TaxID=95172 RepID=A0ABW4QAS2_9MICC
MTLIPTKKRTGGASAPPVRGMRANNRIRNDGIWPWLFLAPVLIGLGAFYLWPIVQTVYFSFTTFGVFGGTEFVGLDNYRQLIQDDQIPRSLFNTVIYTAIVLLGIPIAIFFSSLLNRPGLRFATFYRLLFFMPYVAMPTAVAIVWRTIYNGDYGILNSLLSVFGIDGPHWVSTPGFSLAALGILGLWSALGFSMIILSAGMQGIPTELYEAAQLDGASSWRQFISITVPMLTPSIFLVVIVSTINAFQLFDLLFALMGDSNPAMRETQSLVYLFYSEAFLINDKGYASAIALLIMAFIAIITFVQFRLQRRWVNHV